MFNNLQRNHLLPEKCRAEFKVLSSQAFCLGDVEVRLAYRFLPAASFDFQQLSSCATRELLLFASR